MLAQQRTSAHLFDAIGQHFHSLEQKLRLLRTVNLLRLERNRSESHRHVKHRHHLYHMGSRGTAPAANPPPISLAVLLQTGQAIGRTNPVSGHVRTQLIAHDKEVYDIAFSRGSSGRDIFASVGADGSVRMFDLRQLEHSTIIYEDPQHRSLLRLAWNKQDANYLATFAIDSTEVVILDVRIPCTPVARLSNHRSGVNGMAWAPHSACHLCTAGKSRPLLVGAAAHVPLSLFRA